jgi:phosphonate transport system substrate-binding protein
MNRFLPSISLLLLVAFVTGTLGTNPGAAQGNWREDIGTLRIGVANGETPTSSSRRLELFREALAIRLGMKVEIVSLPDLAALSEAQGAGRVDYAIHSGLSFALTSAACNCVEPLALPVFDGGAKATHSVVIARRGPDGQPVPVMTPDTGSKVGAIGRADTFHAEVLRASLLKEDALPAGFEPDAMIVFETVEEAANALASGQVDAIVGWSTLTGSSTEGYSHGTLRQLLATGGVSIGDVRLVWQSIALPNGPHALRRNLPSEAKSLVQSFLLGLEQSNPAAYDAAVPLLTGGFRPVQLSAFRELKNLLVQNEKAALPVESAAPDEQQN